VTHTLKRDKWRPVEDYLREQGRFSRLFEPVLQASVIAAIQAAVDDYWKRV
jgi:pyruvate ferredoxin oxidoreductase beta subunit